jgi:hypothetical protein
MNIRSDTNSSHNALCLDKLDSTLTLSIYISSFYENSINSLTPCNTFNLSVSTLLVFYDANSGYLFILLS